MLQKRNPNITYFARSDFRKSRKLFGIKQADRAYHTYILGKTGAGKTNLLLTKILQDTIHFRGVCVFDIHGDLIRELHRWIPSYRKKDVIYLNVPDRTLGIGYNPLKKVSYEKRPLVASGILDAFKKLWGSSWGTRMEHILRMILLTLLDQPHATFRDIVRIIQDKEYQKSCIENIVNPDVKNFWIKEFPSYGRYETSSILNKVGAFLAHPSIRRLLIENPNNLSLRRCMDRKKILLINLSKGALGTDASSILGSLLISSITSAAFSRIDTKERARVPFHVFLDEFHNYTNRSLVEMLSELRKFKVSMTFAHQYLDQLNENIKSAVLGNVGTIICFRLGANDAQYMLMELFKDQQPLLIGDYVNLENHRIYLKLMIDEKPSEPFSAKTIYFKDIL